MRATSWGLTRATAAGAGEETWWWSRTMTSTPRWRREAMGATAVEPQSTASSRVAGDLREAIVHRFLAEAVAFVHAMRQVIADLPAEGAEDFEQQGGGGDAVHVVIPEDDEGFVALAGLQEALDGGVHVGEQERVGQLLEPGLEEGGDGGRLSQAPVEQALGEQRGDVERVRELPGEGGVGAARGTTGTSLVRRCAACGGQW